MRFHLYTLIGKVMFHRILLSIWMSYTPSFPPASQTSEQISVAKDSPFVILGLKTGVKGVVSSGVNRSPMAWYAAIVSYRIKLRAYPSVSLFTWCSLGSVYARILGKLERI